MAKIEKAKNHEGKTIFPVTVSDAVLMGNGKTLKGELSELGSKANDLENKKATKVELQAEITRATNAENALSKKIDSETNRALQAESILSKSISDEIDRAKEAEEELENSINANRYGYNVTVNGLKGGIHTIETAIKDVPSKFRMLGQKITFRTKNGDWATYHNESLSLDNYENVNDWVQEVGISSVQGDVNISNNPDYEDLTEAADGTIKFADKEYSKESFSGLGRVFLRKNIVDEVNVLTQDMFAKPNTIYIIQYDYDLQGAEITIPEGCVLDFQGGSLGNGIIIGDDTDILFNKDCFSLVKFKGSYICTNIKSSYFGIYPKGDGTANATPNQMDNLLLLNSFINCCYNITIDFDEGFYGFGGGGIEAQTSFYETVNTPIRGYFPFVIDSSKGSILKSLTLNGNGAKFVCVYSHYAGAWERLDNKLIYTDGFDSFSDKWEVTPILGGFLFLYDKNNEREYHITVNDVTIDMNKDIYHYGGALFSNSTSYYTQVMSAISLRASNKNNVYIFNNVEISNAITDGIEFKHFAKNAIVKNCKINNCGRVGLSAGYIRNLHIDNTVFNANGRVYKHKDSNFIYEYVGGQIDIEPMKSYMIQYKGLFKSNVIITNCQFYETNRYCIVSVYQGIDNFYIDNCTAYNSLSAESQSTSTGEVNIITSILPVFFYVGAANNITVGSVTLTGVGIGDLWIADEPVETNGYLEGEYFFKENARPTLDNVNIKCNPKAASKYILCSRFTNYNYKLTDGKWVRVTTGPNLAGGFHINNLVINLLSTSCIDGVTTKNVTVDNMNVFILEGRKEYPAFFDYSLPIVNNLNIIDINEGDEAIARESASYLGVAIFRKNLIKHINTYKLSGINRGIIYDDLKGRSPEELSFSESSGIVIPAKASCFIMPYNNKDNYFGRISGDFAKKQDVSNSIDFGFSYDDAKRPLFKRYVDKTGETGNFKYDNIYYGMPKKYPSLSIEEYIGDGTIPLFTGESLFDISRNIPLWRNPNGDVVRADGTLFHQKQSGVYVNKPNSPIIGFKYFCTDRQTVEGGTNGIMIYHKGDNVWVDALGRVVE